MKKEMKRVKEEKMEKVKTYVPGLDEILKGGVNKTSSILVTGAPGSGKTIMALQFIYNGAKNGEPGLYITCEETIEDVKRYAKSIGLYFDHFEENGLITFVRQPVTTKKLASIAIPLDIIKEKKVKRVVLDSLTFFEYVHAAGDVDCRKEILNFIWAMKEAGVTLMVTSENYMSDINEFVYKPEDFLFEGLIMLMMIRKSSSFERCLRVVKMRGQEHMIDIYPFIIGDNGIKVFPGQLPFSLIEKEEEKFK